MPDRPFSGVLLSQTPSTVTRDAKIRAVGACLRRLAFSSRSTGESLETFPYADRSRCDRHGRDRARARRGHLRRRRHVSLSDLCEVGRCLQERDRRRTELPVDRLRRRHQADSSKDRHLRRHRYAAESGGTEQGRPGPVSDRARRRCCRWSIWRASNPASITLDGPTLARIFLGEIKTWNDPAIAKLNASAKLAAQPIVVVHRSDGSGTTFIWTDYLSKVSPDWKSKVGVNTAVEWPVGIGAKGNEGVANNVSNTKGSIGYVEYAYAKQNKLTTVKHDQQGRQDGRTEHARPSKRRPPAPTGKRPPGF